MRRLEHSREEILTENLYEASYLVAKNFRVLGFVKQGRKVAIRFLKTAEIEKASLDYFNGGLISAIKFTDAYRRLKDAAFSQMRDCEAKS